MMTDYTDLIARLLEDVNVAEYTGADHLPQTANIREAAAAIAALTAERDALREALDEALTIPYWGDAQDDLVRLSALTAPTTGG